jgi:regulator of protease activity HflC (stomatin/prohibitin superfamily)
LRSIIGKSELDDLLSNREQLHRGLELLIDSPALGWGIHIDRVEIKDVQLPESMKRSMSRQAEAERERRARVITADGEYQALVMPFPVEMLRFFERMAVVAGTEQPDNAPRRVKAEADTGLDPAIARQLTDDPVERA